MSYNSVELIKSVVLLISGKQYSDNDYQYAATCLDNLLKNNNNNSSFQNINQLPIVPIKTATRTSSKTGNCDEEEFNNILNSGKYICSHLLSRGEHKGLRCGKNVTEPDHSLQNNCQFCTSHGGKKATKKIDNSATIFIPEQQPPTQQKSLPQQSNQTFNQFHTQGLQNQDLQQSTQTFNQFPNPSQQFTQPFTRFNNQDILGLSILGVNNISEFFKKSLNGQDIYFNSESNHLVFMKSNNGSYKCQGRIETEIQNNLESLSEDFYSSITTDFTNDEHSWLSRNNININEA